MPSTDISCLCEVSKIQYSEIPSAAPRSSAAGLWRRFRICFLGMGLGALFLMLLKNPGVTAAAALDGILLAAKTVLPSTFPYMILSGVMVSSGVTKAMGRLLRRPVEKLFFLPPAGVAVILMGLLSGFPVGAKCAADLYLAGDCTKEEAERLLCFCNFCGPPFILGSVAGFLGSPRAGLVIYLTQTAGMLVLGILLGIAARKKARAKKNADPAVSQAASRRPTMPALAKPFSLLFYESVKSACPAMLQIAGFVVFFSILSGILEKIAPSGGISAAAIPASGWAITALRGILEISGGARAAAASRAAIGLPGAVFCTAFVTVWSGLSVHMQVASFALPAGLRMQSYYLCRIVTAAAVAAASFGICRVAGIC